MSAADAPAPAPTELRRWRRFSPSERLARWAFYLAAVLAVLWSVQTIEIIPEFLYDAPQQTADLFARMWPIDWAWYPKVVHEALIETLHTATLGTLLALALASPVALMAAPNLTPAITGDDLTEQGDFLNAVGHELAAFGYDVGD